jgi:hypothetical protein
VRKRSVFIATLICLMSLSAFAQATRTWVSGVGDDANPCSRTAPCKTFAGAISKTAAGGIIDALDPGGFGAVTITKAMTLEGNGTLASILSSGVQGIIVNITSGTNRDVVLRNILIDGSGVTIGTNGVNFIAGDSLTIEDCYIKTYSGDGVLFQPNSTAKLDIRNTSILLCSVGVLVKPVVGGFAFTSISNSSLDKNGTGFRSEDNSKGALWRSTFSNNSGDGIFGTGAGGGTSMTVDGCAASGNGTGIHSNGASEIRVANTTITANTTGVSFTNSATLISYVNNRLTQNSAPGTFSSTQPTND